DPIPALSTVRPDLPRELDGVIVTAMAKHPEVRFATAGALADALKAALVGEEGALKAPPAIVGAAPGLPPRPPVPAVTVADVPPPIQAPMPPSIEPASAKTRVMPWRPSRKLWLGGVTAAAVPVVVLSSLSSGDNGTSTGKTGSGTAAPTEPTFNSQISKIVDRVVPAQTRATTLIGALQPGGSFGAVRRAGDALEG